MADCPNDPSNGYGSHNTNHPLPCSVSGCDCAAALRKQAASARPPLTDAQIVSLVGPHADIVAYSRGRVTYEFDGYGLIAFARAVEAAKGE